MQMLLQFPGVRNGKQTCQAMNGNLLCRNTNEVKRQLLEWSLQHNLNIVSLQSGEQRLEEVFRHLTNLFRGILITVRRSRRNLLLL